MNCIDSFKMLYSLIKIRLNYLLLVMTDRKPLHILTVYQVNNQVKNFGIIFESDLLVALPTRLLQRANLSYNYVGRIIETKPI